MTFLAEYSIILPVSVDGVEITTDDVVNYIMEKGFANGVTVTSGLGTWRGRNFVETEDVRIYTFAPGLGLSKAKRLAAYLGRKYHQCEVYLRTPLGVLLIDTRTEDSVN